MDFEANFNRKSLEKKPENMEGESFPDIMLNDCDLSIRAVNYLEAAGFTKLHELSNYTEKELLEKMPFANSKTLKEVKDILGEHHLDFKK